RFTPSLRSTPSAASSNALVRCRSVWSNALLRYPTRRLDGFTVASQLNATSCTVPSFPSGPRMTSSTSAQSSTLRHSGPSLSMLHDSAMAPVRGTRPNVGRHPVTPQRVLGDEMDPSVSLPTPKPTSPADVADAGPADEPLDPSSVFHGLRVMPPNHTSPMASAPSESLATSTAPAASRRCTTVASSSMVCVSYGVAPHVVGYPFTASRSLAPHG